MAARTCTKQHVAVAPARTSPSPVVEQASYTLPLTHERRLPARFQRNVSNHARPAETQPPPTALTLWSCDTTPSFRLLYSRMKHSSKQAPTLRSKKQEGRTNEPAKKNRREPGETVRPMVVRRHTERRSELQHLTKKKKKRALSEAPSRPGASKNPNRTWHTKKIKNAENHLSL